MERPRLFAHFGKNVVIAVSLLAAGFLIAWLRFRPHLTSTDGYTDGTRVFDGEVQERLRFAVWDDPAPLPGELNTAAREARPALSPDGRWMVFEVGEVGLNADLWIARMEDGEPRDAEPLAGANSQADEVSPAFAGDRLYFASNRPGTAGGFDLWSVKLADGVAGAPERLEGGVNTRVDERDPAPIPGGNALVFASNRRSDRRSGYDLYLARVGTDGAFVVERLEALATTFHEREPAFSADGRTLVFSSDRSAASGAPASGGYDLYRSVYENGTWLPPEPLAGVNTAADERGPLLTADGFGLYYGVERASRPSDLYRARSIELFQRPGDPVGLWELLIVAALLVLALLAWLARRWESLEVVYRCFLVSLIVHLLLLLWFREIRPESEIYPLESGDDLFHVRLAARSEEALSGARERQGRIEAERAAPSMAEGSPERVETARAADAPARAADRSLDPAEARAANAPNPTTFRATPTPSMETPAPPIRGEAPSLDRRTASAPAVEVAPAEALGSRSSSEAAPPARAEFTGGDRAAASPGARSLDLAAEHAAPAPTRTSVATSGGSRAEPARVAAELASPSTDHTPRTAEAPGLAVSGVALARSAPAAVTGPERRAAQAPPGTAELTPTDRSALEVGSAGRESTRPLPERAEVTLAPRSFERGTSEIELAADSSAPPSAPRTQLAAALELPAPKRAERTTGDAASAPSARSFERSRTSTVPAPTPDRPAHSEAPAARAVELPERRGEALQPESTPDTPEVAIRGAENAGASVEPALSGRAEPARELGLVASNFRRATRAPATAPAPAASPAAKRTGDSADRPVPDRRHLEVAAAPAPVSAPAARERWEHTPYQSRTGIAKAQALAEFGGDEETEAAVAAGLEYLASVQHRTGYWGERDDTDDKYGYTLVGKTGLCLLAFLGAGHTQEAGTEYEPVVKSALAFLRGIQDPESGHFGFCAAYGHAIATYALAECYALTDDPALEETIVRAVEQILRNQNKKRSDARRFGGWSYYYPDGHTYDSWPRASITAWQVMALESARLGGIDVPDRAFDDARAFLEAAWDEEEGWYRYNHKPDRLAMKWRTLPGSTPASIFALSLLGDDASAEEFARARAFVSQRAPSRYRRAANDDAFVLRAKGNLYFWYYGTLALFRAGGPAWERWNVSMKETLLPAQEDNGSWEPISVYAEYAGDDRRDRSYTTAMCVLTLEVYYRYFTPLLQVTEGR